MFQTLSVSPDGHFILQQDGTPFFYLADTAWELFHRVNQEDARWYLRDRAAKGFTAIQAVVLAEFDGLRKANAFDQFPLKKNKEGVYDPLLPDLDADYNYWAHVDFIVREAAALGLYIAMLPTWGDKFNQLWGEGPEIFTPDNAFSFGKWIGERYANSPNIIWILGGDRPLETRQHFDIIYNMAQGIRTAVDKRHLVTFHPAGGRSSGENLHQEEWLDFNMLQSGHSRHSNNYAMVEKEYDRVPAKPVVDGEPGYEYHPESFHPQRGYLDDADCRNYAYQALLSGACGHTYGNHSVWGMVEALPVAGFQPGHFCTTWRKALNASGAAQMRYAKDLLLSRNYHEMNPCPELVVNPGDGWMHVPVLRSEKCLLAYTAQGQPIELKTGYLQGKQGILSWMNPRNGEWTKPETVDDERQMSFLPPSGGRGQDWVLVIDVKE